jgi:hypothetical protein
MHYNFPTFVQLKGGLGNQLFQYTFGRWLESKFKARVFYDGRGLSNAKSPRAFELVNFHLWEEQAERFLLENQSQFGLRMLAGLYKKTGRQFYEQSSKLQNHNYISFGNYYGFWQQASMVQEILLTQRDSFNLNPCLLKEDYNFLENETSVAIHIRGSDYLHHPTLINLSATYYQKAIETMISRLNNPKFYIFTDDVEHASKLLPGVQNQYIETGNNLLDFATLSRCKNQIIANSTFSWWAAILNNNPTKLVIAPKVWDRVQNPSLNLHSHILVSNE